MKEAYATFPPLKAQMTYDGSSTESITARGYDSSFVSSVSFRGGKHVPIDLRGLSVDDKLLKINNIHMARLPSFDNTANKTGKFGIYQVTDIHLVTTSPIVVETLVSEVGIAPAQNWQIQVDKAVDYFNSAGYNTNNGYNLPSPGILQGDSGNTNLPFFNLDPNMIVFCQTDVLTTNVQSDPFLATMLVPVDSSVYGMGDLAALETLHCYRFIFGTWTNASTASTIEAIIGPSIIQMNTQAVKMPDLERLQVMDTNFNTTNPLVD